jgi:hypothetical protein
MNDAKDNSGVPVQAGRLLRLPLRTPSPDEGVVDISQGPARVLTFPGAAEDVGNVNGDDQNRKRYPGLTRSQKMQRIVTKVLSDELPEDKLGAILSQIEHIIGASGGN